MKRNIMVMNVLAIFFWMSMYTYVPTMSAYSISLGADAAVLGIIGGVYGITQVIIRVPLGALSDKTGKNRLLLIIGSVILFVSALIMAIGNDTGSVIWGRLVAGIAAAWWVIMCAAYADYYPEDRQIKAQGIINFSNSLGKVLAALIGGFTAQYFGLKSPFYFAMIAAGASVVMALMLKDSPSNKRKPSIKETFALFKNKDILIFSFFAIVAQMICFGVATMFSQVAAQNLGASSFELGMLTVVFFSSTAASSLLAGTKAYKKIGGKLSVCISFATAAVSCIPFFYHINVTVIYFMQVLAGICYGIGLSALSGFVIKAVAPEQKAGATGIFQCLFAIGITLGPMIAGGVINALDFDTAYMLFFGITAATAALSLIIIPKRYDKM